MANSLLTPTKILREAGRLFHSKAKFIRSINRQYDNQYAQTGAKVGYSITLRDRNEFTVSTGATMVVQDVTESSQVLTLGTQKHVGMSFQSNDLALVIDDFSERYIEPAMARLVANIEGDIITQARNATFNMIDDHANAFSFLDVAKAKQRLDEFLTPEDDARSLMLCPTHSTKYLDATKGLFTPHGKLGAQYGDGRVKDALGFDVFGNVKLTAHTTGTAVASTGYTVNGASQTGSTINVTGGSTTFLVGDVVTFAGCNAVDQESKADLGYLQNFTITANSGTSASSLSISPAIVTSGAKQNVTASPTTTGAVTKLGGGTASVADTESLAYHKDAYIFATADLEDPSRYGAWGAVQQMDSLSMRIWRQGDILNDKFPCRIDVFYGFLARYPRMGVRICANG